MKYLFLMFAFVSLISFGPSAPKKKKFTIVLIPDTQHYTHKFQTLDTYKKQMQWIANNRESENIKFVIQLGDITDDNTDDQWEVAREAENVLDNDKIPHSMLPGNHDYPGGGGFTSRNSAKYNQYFGPQWFNIVDYQSWYRGHMGSTNDNNYCFFESDGLKFVVISLEYSPRKEALCWADQIIRKNKDRRVIIATHCYQTSNGGRCNCPIGYTAIGNTHADHTWKELVKKHSNIFMMLSGHVTDSEHKVSIGSNGNKVHEILTDYQSELMDNRRYGNGWMKTLTFDPDNNTVSVKTFTVLSSVTELNMLDSETGDRYSSNPNSSDHKFSFTYNMTSELANNVELNNVGFSDITVNTESDGQQYKPSIAVAKNGDYVVAWEDDKDGNGKYQIYTRGFYAGGCEKFPVKTVNIDPSGQQRKPKVGISDDGSFIVVWEDDRDGNDTYQIRAARFNGMGVKKSLDFTVNIDATGQQLRPDVAVAPNGDFVVTWEDDSQGAVGTYQIYARGFRSNGSQKFAPITVNSNANGQQLKPVVGISSSGLFVVAWEDDNDGNDKYQILAARFNAQGVKQGNDFTVNSNPDGQQKVPAIAMNASGNFVITWQDDNNDNGLYQVKATRYNSLGVKQGNDFTVNSDAGGQQVSPSVSISSNGDFVIVWQDDKDSNNKYQIYGRGFKANGSQIFADKAINSNSAGQQKSPDIGLNWNGDFITVWEDDIDDNSKYEIVARGLTKNGNEDPVD